MSAINTYQVEARDELGRKAAGKLRAAGKVPVTLSRRNQPSRHFALAEKDAREFDAHVVHLCRLELGKEAFTALRADVAKDVLTDRIIHIDLNEVDEKSTIKVDVAVRVNAMNCPGVKAGGIVEQRMRKVKVRCPANAIPDAIEVDIDDVQLMQTITVERLKLPAGVSLLTPARMPLLSVVIPRGMKKAEDEAAAAPAAGAEGEAKPAEGAKEGAKPEAAPAAKGGDAKKK